MRLFVKLARLLPQIRRLHEERNRLADLAKRLANAMEQSGNENSALSDKMASQIERAQVEYDEYHRKSDALERRLPQTDRAYADLVVRIDHISAERNEFQWKLEELERKMIQLDQSRGDGRLVEFDYAYRPRVRDWQNQKNGNRYHELIARHDDRYQARLFEFAKYREQFARVALNEPADGAEPFWDNGWIPPLDAICLYGLVATTNPARYVEVGSGNSTKFVRRAISDNGLKTKVSSIDPQPRAVIDRLCDVVVRHGLEDVDLSLFSDLEAGDIVFIDNSHRSFQNSDVTVFFTEALPLLKPGVLWGLHDIFLPADYPVEWLRRMYNEQYLLMSYLLGGADGDSIELPVSYLARCLNLSSSLGALLVDRPWGELPLIGGGFWLIKG
jgi:predicted O-methyltransferase YrrM